MVKSSLVIGLTGQTGAGKSTVSAFLREQGYPVIDADIVARQVVQKGSACLMELVAVFGGDILDAEGNLNRKKLGAMVFADREQRMKLNDTIFPYIKQAIVAEISTLKQRGETMIVLDAPTLFESGSERFCDKIASVIASESTRLARILARDALTQEEAHNRMASQQPDEFYTSRSDAVLRNDGDFAQLQAQALAMMDTFGQH